VTQGQVTDIANEVAEGEECCDRVSHHFLNLV
jgi:hypothetical protein